jgi:diguanylate cyclase (GGDEF)-like protein
MVTVSIGVAELPQHGASAEELLKAADAALYQAKRDGRDRVAVALTPTVAEVKLC